jgi:hypothetical protein
MWNDVCKQLKAKDRKVHSSPRRTSLVVFDLQISELESKVQALQNALAERERVLDDLAAIRAAIPQVSIRVTATESKCVTQVQN